MIVVFPSLTFISLGKRVDLGRPHDVISLTHKAQWLNLHKEAIHIHRIWDETRLPMYHNTIEYFSSLEQMIKNLQRETGMLL